MAVTIVKNTGSVYAEYDNVKETFPVSTAGAGTVAVASRVITGTSTTFLTNFVKGDWIWLKDNDELRRIESVSDDTRMILETSATTDASTTYGIIKREGFNSVGYAVDDVASAKINTISMPKSMSETFRTDLKFIPILIDSTPNANKVILSAKNW